MSADPKLLALLLSQTVQFGQQMVRNHGTFYPFAFKAGVDGKVGMVGVWNGEEPPDRREIYKLLDEGLRSEIGAAKVSAVALGADVTIPSQYRPIYPDGIRVHIESPGYSRYIYMPYSRVANAATGKSETTFGEMFAVEAPSLFSWPQLTAGSQGPDCRH